VKILSFKKNYNLTIIFVGKLFTLTVFFKFLCFVLILISVLSLAFTKSNYNVETVDLLTIKGALEEGVSASGYDVNFTNEDNKPSIECNVEKDNKKDICGLVFKLPQKNGKGFPLDKYDALHFNIESHSNYPGYRNRIRIFVKSYLDSYEALLGDDSDFKYHAVRIEDNGRIVVPLSRFKVETWWEDKHNIPFDLSYIDMTSVYSIEFFINDMPVKGPAKYNISLTKLDVVGSLIKDSTLYSALFYTWLVFLVFFYFLFKLKDFKKIKKQAYFDPYSTLLNMIGFYERYNKIVNKEATFYRIRIVNWDNLVRHFGLTMSNYLLAEVIDRNVFFYKDIFYIGARLNNNEFLLVKKGKPLSNEQEQAFINSLLDPVPIEGIGALCLDIKIGVSPEKSLPKDCQFVLERTEISIQSILHDKKRLQVYSSEVSQKAERKTFLEKQIKIALKKNAFYLLYMPIYSASEGRFVGVEALLRCSLDELRTLSPEAYVSVAEETGLIRDIDLMVIEMALRDISCFDLGENFTLSINISSKELLDNSFVSNFKDIVNKTNIGFNRLCLEVTETFLLEIDSACVKTIRSFRDMGCKVSLDDFGTGYTSFQQLINFPVDEIKIDREFISGMKSNKGYDVIVDSLLSIANVYGYKVVAEGIEDKEVYQVLLNKGCDLFQGYFFSKPVSLAEIMFLHEKLKIEGLLPKLDI
jgi:EAL domain-containing protein (putative c-di-GMP-specific phosphodiesterase class I)/GGDEF domain-containing protein